MRAFAQNQIAEAILWAAAGGQALHLHRLGGGSRTPSCFRRDLQRGLEIAHLFDWSVHRLTATGRGCWMRKTWLQKTGTGRQHLDLCGRSLKECRAFVEPVGEGVDRWPALAALVTGVSFRRPSSLTRPGGANPDEWEPRLRLPRNAEGLYGSAWYSNATSGPSDPTREVRDDLPHPLLSVMAELTGGDAPLATRWARTGVKGYPGRGLVGVLYRKREDAFRAVARGLEKLDDAARSRTAGWFDERFLQVEELVRVMTPAIFADRHRDQFGTAPDERLVATVFRGRAEPGQLGG